MGQKWEKIRHKGKKKTGKNLTDKRESRVFQYPPPPWGPGGTPPKGPHTGVGGPPRRGGPPRGEGVPPKGGSPGTGAQRVLGHPKPPRTTL